MTQLFIPQTLLAIMGFLPVPQNKKNVWRPRSYQSVATFVFPRRLAPSEFPKCRYLLCSRRCPGGACRPRVSAHVQVGFAGFEVSNVSFFTFFAPLPGGACRPRSSLSTLSCPGRVCRPRDCRSIAIYRVPALAQVEFATLEVTKVLPFIVCPPLPRWG